MKKGFFRRLTSLGLSAALAFTSAVTSGPTIEVKAAPVEHKVTLSFLDEESEPYTADQLGLEELPFQNISQYTPATDPVYVQVNEAALTRPEAAVSADSLGDNVYLKGEGTYTDKSAELYDDQEAYTDYVMAEFSPGEDGDPFAASTFYSYNSETGIYTLLEDEPVEFDATQYYTVDSEEAFNPEGLSPGQEAIEGSDVSSYYTRSGEEGSYVYTPCGENAKCTVDGVYYNKTSDGTPASGANEDAVFDIPEVPEREGYTGAWSFTAPTGAEESVVYDDDEGTLTIDGEWLNDSTVYNSGYEAVFTAEYTVIQQNVLTVEGMEYATTYSAATDTGTVTVNNTAGTITFTPKYSTGNYPGEMNGNVSWHPNHTTGYFLAFKASVPEEYTITRTWEGGAEGTKEQVKEFALVRPWARNGDRITFKVYNDSNDVVQTKTYTLNVAGYVGGPLDADSANLPAASLLGKSSAADLQSNIAFTFDPVPTSETKLFDYGEFQDGSCYGGTGTVTGKLKYQESYPDWGAADGGYFLAFHINSDYKYMKGMELVNDPQARIYVATSDGEPLEEGKTYGWRQVDYNDFVNIWQIKGNPAGKKLVIKKVFADELPEDIGDGDETGALAGGDKDVYYIYDLSALQLEKVIKFDANGGSGSMDIMREADMTEGATLPACTFTNEGKFFTGWALTEDATEATILDEATISSLGASAFDNGVLTLYAVWEDYVEYGLVAGDADEVFEKDKDNIQSGITINEDKITGTLKPITGWTAFSSKATEQSGHYIYLKVNGSEPAKVAIVPSYANPSLENGVTLDSDRDIVLRVTNKDEQKVKVWYGEEEPRLYDLSGLTLEGFAASATFGSGEQDLLGKAPSDLQTGVEVTDAAITGTLKYVYDYEDFSGNEDEQNGHYLALNVDVPNAKSLKYGIKGTYTTNATSAELEAGLLDRELVIIVDEESLAAPYGKLNLEVTYEDGSVEKRVYDVSGLTLAPEPEPDFEVVNPTVADFGSVFGNKTPEEIQSTLTITDGENGAIGNIRGTLYEVTGFAGFGSARSSGYYLSFEVQTSGKAPSSLVASFEKDGETTGIPADLTNDPDKTALFFIGNKDASTLVVTAEYDDGKPDVVKKYDISGLELDGFAANTIIPENTDFFGKTLADIQSGVEITDNTISGSLKYIIDGWNPGTWGEDMSSGHYLALHVDGATTDTAVVSVSGTRYPVDASDGLILLYVGNEIPEGSKISLERTYADESVVTREYDISGLTLEPKPVEITFTVDSEDIEAVSYMEFADEAAYEEYLSENGGTDLVLNTTTISRGGAGWTAATETSPALAKGTCYPGRFVVADFYIESPASYYTFTRLEADGAEIAGEVNGDYYSGVTHYRLGTLTADFEATITTAKLPTTALQFAGDVYDSEHPEKAGYVGYLSSYSSSDYLSTSYNNLQFELVKPDTVTEYRMDPAATYEVTKGSGESGKTIDKGRLNIRTSPPEYSYAMLPEDVVRTAAFEGATITITAKVMSSGKQKQNLYMDVAGGADVKVKVGGEVLDPENWNNYDYDDWGQYALVPYGRNATVELTADTGYDLGGVYYVSKDAISSQLEEFSTISELRSWAIENGELTAGTTGKVVNKVNVSGGKALVNISNMDKYYFVFATTTSRYALLADGNEIANGATIDAYYNVPQTITLVKGEAAQNLGTAATTITATIPGATSEAEPVDVTEAVFGVALSDAYYQVFSGTASQVQGKEVTVNIKSLATEGEGEAAKPVYDYTFKVKVSEPITGIGFKSTEEFVLAPGTTKVIDLTVPATGFDKNCYKPKVSGLDSEYVSVAKSADGKSLILTVDPDDYIYTRDNLYTLKLLDSHNVTTELTTTGIAFTVSTAQVTGADLSKIKATAGVDTIKFDFSAVNGSDSTGKFDTKTEGLYYRITANNTTTGTALVAGFASHSEILVPATATSYNLILVDNDNVIAADPQTYTATVELVQLKTGGVFAVSTTPYTNAELATVVGGKFATKISFTKNKSVPKKLYNTMDEDFVLGTVKYNAVNGSEMPVQRLSKVEIQTTKGELRGQITAGQDLGFLAEKDNVITFNPREFGLVGKFNVVAYALEPMGKEVTCKYTLNIAQGITGVTVTAPSTVYKTSGKSATVKATVTYTPNTKPLPTKKVSWALTKNAYGTIPFTLAGVSINKKGTVTIGKNVVIPDDGLDFYIKAIPADYAGRENDAACDTTYVKVHDMRNAEAPAYIEMGDVELKNGESYATSELSMWGGIMHPQAFYADMTPVNAENVTYKVSGLKAYKVNGKVVGYYAPKANVKNVSIKATLNDGSKKSYSVKFNIKSDENLELYLADYDHRPIDMVGGASEGTFNSVNDYASGKYMTLVVSGRNGGLIDHTAKFTGLKKVSTATYDMDEGYPGTIYTLNPTAHNAKIVIKDNKTGETQTINLTNSKLAKVSASIKVAAVNYYDTSYDSKKGVAKQTNKKGTIIADLYYPGLDTYEAAGSVNKVTYTVTKSGTAVADTDVIISTTDAYLDDDLFERNGAVKVGESEYKMHTDAKGQFVVDYVDADGTYHIPTGKHKFTVTPVDAEGVAITKTATVTLKAAAAPKAKVSIKSTSYSKFTSSADISFKTMSNIVFFDTEAAGDVPAKANAASSAWFTGKLLGVNSKGVINKFATVFSTTTPVGKLTCVMDPKDYDAAYTASPNKGMQGWIEYRWMNLDGTTGRATVKVTVKPPKGGQITPAPAG
ncbi:hypothetical protein [Butyrivibrio sp. MC2013]|uniref:hypothetical protein n=1 Tax=Butyrivibrio sp. MC2013 TaxID=1280686 RepID=UPI0004029C72|nr:hypothetical protein [Butyrivibrio sp. MC2013]